MADLTAIIGACVGITLAVIVVLLIFSISALEYNEYGLDYSAWSKTVDKDAYTGGLHVLGLGHSFIKFPKTIQQVEFSENPDADKPSIESRTKDGLSVILEISFQYVLKMDNLHQLYMQYVLDYPYIIENVAVDTLTDLASSYTAYDFFIDRRSIGNDMLAALDKSLMKCCSSSVAFFQLRSVDLPDEFEDSIQLSEVKKQDIQRAEAENSATKVEVQTWIKKAELGRNITTNLAEGKANSYLQEVISTLNGLNATELSQVYGYSKIKTDLAYDNEALLQYLKNSMVKEYKGESMTVALPHPKETSKKE